MGHYLKQDTYSNQNPNKLYGRAGEAVAIIEDRDGILVVQVSDREPFCVLRHELRSDDPAQPPADPPASRKLVKAPQPPQGSLF